MKRSKKDKPVKILTREQRVKQFKDVPPSQLFYNPHTIKWFRHRYNEDLIKKSIYSLFPNNCEPMMTDEENTPMRILMEWLSHYLKPENKYKDIWINPKYFFPKITYDKILKLKEIFLQFDEDGSRKMEIDEMTTMFKTNRIDVTEDDLCSLFFKGKKFRKADINKLYLDFYQFMQFALSKKSDQDFRLFMRGIKKKIMKEKEMEKEKMEKEKIEREQKEERAKMEEREKEEKEEEEKEEKEKEEDNDKDSDEESFDKESIQPKSKQNDKDKQADPLNYDSKNEPIFLPMNFNLVLDYFINKGKERKSQKKIRKAIKMMKNILQPGTYPDDDKDFLPSEGEEDSFNNDSKSNSVEEVETNEYDRQLKEINTKEIMEEFEKLFKMSYTPEEDIPGVFKPKRKKLKKLCTMIDQTSKMKLNIDELNRVRRKATHVNDGISKNKLNYSFEREKKLDDQDDESVSNLIFPPEKKDDGNNEQLEELSGIAPKKQTSIFSDVLRRKIELKNIQNIQRSNYDKFHSVKLAKEHTMNYIKTLGSKEEKNRKGTIGKKNEKGCILPSIGPSVSQSCNFSMFRKKKKTRFLY